MGNQVIKQPDGFYAVFSSVVDAWVLVDATPCDIADYFAEKAADSARESVARIMEAVEAGQPCKAYYQFAMTFEEADRMSREHDGMYWRDGEWVESSTAAR
jgi:hypothetical protein